ncbi:MAG: site-2 protease family protein [Cyanobacteria bacterium P01_E01_bin.6]
MVTFLILLGAIGTLIWGFRRARPYGKIGVLAWLQSIVLVAPWLLFFSLSAVGIFLNFAVVLTLIVSSTGVYIWLGSQLRAESRRVMPPNVSEFCAEQPGSSRAVDQPPNQAALQSGHAPSSINPSPEGLPGNPDNQHGRTEVKPQVKGSSDEHAPAILETISKEDLQAIKGIFGIDTFYSTESAPYQDGAAFKGNLRGDAAVVYQNLSASLSERMGDRYDLYLLEGPDKKPLVIVLPTTNAPLPTTPFQWIISVILAIATFVTCLETAGILQGFNVFQDSTHLPDSLWIGGGIMSILVVHEIGHWVKAKQHHVRLSPPFFIPALQIGSFGSLTRFESILPNRTVLFDISVAGPLFGGTLSLVFLIIGLLLSHQGSLFQVPTSFFQGSVLVGLLARAVLGIQMNQALVDIHPLTILGWLGLIITALNLMPAGQLDGGRIVQAIYGRTIARRMTIATVILLGVVTLVQPLALYWAIVILFLQRNLERPSLNELTEPNDIRAALGLLALFLTAAILLPLTPGLSGQLGIGG